MFGRIIVIKKFKEGLDCGHYLQEEQPKKVLEWFKNFYNE